MAEKYLHAVSCRGDLDAVRHCLSHANPAVDGARTRGRTARWEAAARGHGQGDLNWYTNGWLREQIAARQRDGEKLLAALDEYEEACA